MFALKFGHLEKPMHENIIFMNYIIHTEMPQRSVIHDWYPHWRHFGPTRWHMWGIFWKEGYFDAVLHFLSLTRL